MWTAVKGKTKSYANMCTPETMELAKKGKVGAGWYCSCRSIYAVAALTMHGEHDDHTIGSGYTQDAVSKAKSGFLVRPSMHGSCTHPSPF
jgi:hypothetical protein